MMTWLSNLRLSLSQWALVSMAAVIGVLVALLKIQGSRLHYFQIQALEEHYNGVDKADEVATQAALSKYAAALKEYNGGK